MSDILKSGQTGPSKVLNNVPQSPKDVGDVYKPDSEKHMAKTLAESLKVTGRSTYKTKR
ncbi:hypothetical protein [Bradyrhizobium sp.]|uniref:hypothetical protein n=1 Tax=Bradyrhizobium sp. TaxID=376 RepID=UPI003BB07503